MSRRTQSSTTPRKRTRTTRAAARPRTTRAATHTRSSHRPGCSTRATATQTAAPTAAPTATRRSVLSIPLRARYDAAVTNDDNRRHWANADALSANAAASPAVRRILRMRARYEVANNSYARGIVLTLANDVIGTGPRLQMLTADAEANRVVESEFARWAQAVNLAEKLRTMRMARASDGEAFGLLTNNPGIDTPVQLDLRLLEAEQVATPDRPLFDQRSVDGIVFDAFGNPVEYHVLKVHPGDAPTGQFFGTEYDRVPAIAVLHYYRTDRPGQSRGIPDIMPALPLFAQLRRFTLAVIAAAETAADFAAVLYTDAPPDVDDDDGRDKQPEPMDLVELERRMATVLPDGWKLGQIEAAQPSTTYGEFKEQILNEIARCLNMPFNVAAGNSSAYNYASGRLDHQTYFKSIRVEQTHLGRHVLDRLLVAWLNEAVLIEGYLPQELRMRDVDLSHQWFWDGSEHVDPAKEATAQATRLGSHTTTLAAEYAKAGLDWESELRQRAREVALMRKLKLQPTAAAPTPTPEKETDDARDD